MKPPSVRISAHAFGQCWVPAWIGVEWIGQGPVQTEELTVHSAAGPVAHDVLLRIEFNGRAARDLKARLREAGYRNVRLAQEEPHAAR